LAFPTCSSRTLFLPNTPQRHPQQVYCRYYFGMNMAGRSRHLLEEQSQCTIAVIVIDRSLMSHHRFLPTAPRIAFVLFQFVNAILTIDG
jgi:hypothetical protein